MSVLVSDRKESKFEAVVYAETIHDMLIEFMQRGFEIRDLKHFVRMQYVYGRDDTEDYSRYSYLMQDAKKRIDQTAALMTYNVRAANSRYPTTMREFEKRREHQNTAIVNCEQLIYELQRIVKIFDVDINVYAPYVKAIKREIVLIKKWRQHDNKLRISYLPKRGDI